MANKKLIAALERTEPEEAKMHLRDACANIPSEAELRVLIDLVKGVVFPEFFGMGRPVGRNLDEMSWLLRKYGSEAQVEDFLDSLPEVKRLLLTDVAAVAHNDPAVENFAEVVLSYPVIKVMCFYRTAHRLYELGFRMLPRLLTEIAHSDTGIDIHPAAQIGEYFAIDHGTGVVIGETSIIGNHVMLYQGVTLGARNFTYAADGTPVNEPRHPILEDNVTVYSNTSILGRVRIGHDTVIGGNIWLTKDVPPCSKLVQSKVQNVK